jgi:hypothetical protein
MTDSSADDWRIEQYQDETDPFASLQWYVMRGNAVIATCEVEAHAMSILAEHQRHQAYALALARIAGLGAGDGLAARAIAREALQGEG